MSTISWEQVIQFVVGNHLENVLSIHLEDGCEYLDMRKIQDRSLIFFKTAYVKYAGDNAPFSVHLGEGYSREVLEGALRWMTGGLQ